MELEAMRKDDRSWHPCSISLSTSGPATLTVAIPFKSFSEEYVIANKDEVQSYLRYRSIHLQDGECSNVEEGDRVLATDKDQSKHLFFDAVVEKVRRVKHSKRVYCRCTFEVKWLQSKSQLEDVLLSSNSIMKLSEKSIDSHSVVAEFLNSLNSTRSTSDISFLDQRTPECDIQGLLEFDIRGLLEKQIEEISRAVDSSVANCVDEVIIGSPKAGFSAQTAPNGDAIKGNLKRRNLRSSTNAQRKTEPELDIEKKIEDSSFLTPLAARAALASLMHDLPNSPKFSDFKEKEEVLAKIPSSPKDKDQAFNNDCSSQGFGTRRAEYESESKKSVLNRQHISRSLYHSEHTGTPNCPRQKTRLTRSTAQAGDRDAKNVWRKWFGEDKKTNMRLTRSMVEKGNPDLVEEIQNKCLAAPVTHEPENNQMIHKVQQDWIVCSQAGSGNCKSKCKGDNISRKESKWTRLTIASTKTKGNEEEIDCEIAVSCSSDESDITRKGTKWARHANASLNTEVIKEEIQSKMTSSSTSNGNNITGKGTKRTRHANASANTEVNKEEIPVDDKSPPDSKQNGSCRKPGTRFSPRLRLLQSNGSQK